MTRAHSMPLLFLSLNPLLRPELLKNTTNSSNAVCKSRQMLPLSKNCNPSFIPTSHKPQKPKASKTDCRYGKTSLSNTFPCVTRTKLMDSERKHLFSRCERQSLWRKSLPPWLSRVTRSIFRAGRVKLGKNQIDLTPLTTSLQRTLGSRNWSFDELRCRQDLAGLTSTLISKEEVEPL